MSAKQYLSTSLAGLSLALLMSVWAPSASAQSTNPFCNCMCMEGSPQWICVEGFSVTEDPMCRTMACPSVEEASGSGSDAGSSAPPADSTTDNGGADAIDPPVARDGSAMSGLECRMRKIYRPDLGRYKRHKVCRLTPERRAELRERLAQLGDRHESAIERLRAKHERRAARRAARAERRAQRRAAAESTGDDD